MEVYLATSVSVNELCSVGRDVSVNLVEFCLLRGFSLGFTMVPLFPAVRVYLMNVSFWVGGYCRCCVLFRRAGHAREEYWG